MALKGNEFRQFFNGNSAYISGYDFTVASTVDTKLVTLTGLGFTLTKEAVVGGIVWDVTNQEMIPSEDVTITTGPDTITFNTKTSDFDGTETILVILIGPNRLVGSGGGSIGDTVVDGEDAGSTTHAGQVIVGFDGSNFRILKTDTDGQLKLANYTSASDSNRTEEIDPLPSHVVTETIADVTNGTDGTYNYYIDMETYQKSAIQLILDGGSGTVTVKLYGTVQGDGTAPASCVYEDIGSDTFSTASWTSDDILADHVGKLAVYTFLKIEVVASTGGANDADWTIFNKRLY